MGLLSKVLFYVGYIGFGGIGTEVNQYKGSDIDSGLFWFIE